MEVEGPEPWGGQGPHPSAAGAVPGHVVGGADRVAPVEMLSHAVGALQAQRCREVLTLLASLPREAGRWCRMEWCMSGGKPAGPVGKAPPCRRPTGMCTAPPSLPSASGSASRRRCSSITCCPLRVGGDGACHGGHPTQPGGHQQHYRRRGRRRGGGCRTPPRPTSFPEAPQLWVRLPWLHRPL